MVYPLILNFAVSGELDLNGFADPLRVKPKGTLTFENGDVNLVATQVCFHETFLMPTASLIANIPYLYMDCGTKMVINCLEVSTFERAHFTRAQGSMTIETQNLSLVENAKTIPLHFILELEGLVDQGSLNDEKPT